MTTMHHSPPGTPPFQARRRAASASSVAAATTLVGSIEQERMALAGSLHDGVVQGLVAARLAVDIAERRGADPDTLAPVRSALAGAMHDAREALWSLRSRGGEGEVSSALRVLAEHLAEHGGPTLECHGATLADGVTRTTGVLAYRVVQQVAAQAGAGTVSVDISRAPDGALRLVICAASLDHPPGGPLVRALGLVATCGGTVLPVPAGLVVTIPPVEEVA